MEPWAVPAAVLAALAVLILPGLPAALALRLRGTTLAVILAPLSLLMVTAAAELGHQLGVVPWTFLSPLVLGLLLGLVLWLALGRRRARHRADTPGGAAADGARPGFFATARGGATAIIAGLLLGGGLILTRALMMMGGVNAVSQSYDNVFHLNAIRHILRHQDASAWVVGGMTQLEGNASYYPSLWHQAASLVTQLSGQEIVLSSNVLMLLVGAVVWPVGLVALVRGTTSAGPAGWFLAGTFAGISGSFPLSLMAWGIVLPYLLSIALMPPVVMGIANIAGLAGQGRDRLRPAQLITLLVAACGAAAVAHPQGVFVGIALGVPILVWSCLVRLGQLIRREPGAGRALAVFASLTVMVVVVSAGAWVTARPPQSSAVWGPNASLKEAIGQIGSLSPNATPTFIPLGVVMAAALLGVLLLSRSRWLVASWLSIAVLAIAARALPFGDLRYLLTGTWYSDNYRVSAAVIVVAVPVLAVGLDAIGQAAVRQWPALRRSVGPLPLLPLIAVAAGLGILGASQASDATRINDRNLRWDWQQDHLLSDDERELLELLPDVVPEDAVIATNAWNGSSLAYAISDRDVLNTYMGFEAPPEVHLLNAELDEANTKPEVCDAAADLNVEYALDFGPRELHDRTATYTGLNEISETGAAEEVLRVGDAALLKMLPCRGTDGSMNE